MDVASAKMLGAGIAMIALAGVGIGMGTIFGFKVLCSVRRIFPTASASAGFKKCPP